MTMSNDPADDGSSDSDSMSKGEELSDISSEESIWKPYYQWLYEHGYQLGERLSPMWTPSWREMEKEQAGHGGVGDYEGNRISLRGNVVDAIRLEDNRQVVLKYVDQDIFPVEREITGFLSSHECRSVPENHCVELMEVLHPPSLLRHSGLDTVPGKPRPWNVVFLVFPLLRPLDSPRFDTVGEAVDFFGQLFEGIQFMHKHRVAHRDINLNNVMLDPTSMFPEGFHPCFRYKKREGHRMAKRFTRTARPPKYAIIDFGLSHRFASNVVDTLVPVVRGADRTVPEFRNAKQEKGTLRLNPFPTDIYYAGNLIRQVFDKPSNEEMDSLWGPGFHGFKFMRPLVEKMVQEDPMKRPTIEQVIKEFEAIVKGLSSWKLRSRIRARKVNDDPYYWLVDHSIYWLVDPAVHWARRIKYVVSRRSAIPAASIRSS